MNRTTAWLLLLCLATSSGCAAARMDRAMQTWVGHHYGDLIASWGPPTETLDDGSGGKILVWTVDRSFTTSGTAKTKTRGNTSKTTYTDPVTYQSSAHRMFWIDADGIIYRWARKGT